MWRTWAALASRPDGLSTKKAGGLTPASSDWSYPATEISSSPLALIVVLSAAETALIQAAVLGVFGVPLMADIQLAQQGPKHGLLRSVQCAAPAFQ